MLSKRTRRILLQTGIAISISFTSMGLAGTVMDTVVAEAAVVNTTAGTLTVKAVSLWAYSAPSWTAKSRTYNQGTVLQVVAKHEVEGRYMYKLSNGLYISANTSYVTFVQTGTSAPVVSPVTTSDTRVTTVNLNMRSGAGTNYSLLLTVPKGTTLTVQSVSGTWAKVAYGGKTGYVSTAYLTKVQTSAPAPTPPPVVEAPVTADTRATTVNLNMRSGAGTTYSVLLTIPKGTTLTIQSVSGTWAKVAYSGKTGYVSTAYLTAAAVTPPPVVAPTPPPVVEAPATDKRTTTANLNMRSGAGTTYSVLLTIPKGTTVTVQSVSGTWAKVAYGGKTGFVSTAYLTAAAVTPPPVVEPTPPPVVEPTPPPVVEPTPPPVVEPTPPPVVEPTPPPVVEPTPPPVVEPTPPPVVETPAEDRRVTAENLNMRSGAGTSYSILLTIPKGTTLTVESVSGTWAKVSYGGKTGFVSTAYLTKAPETTPPPVVEPTPPPVVEPTPPPVTAPVVTVTKVTTGNLNMRSGPATTFAILTTIPKGTNLVALEDANGWTKVSYAGKTGYAANTFLQVVSTVETPQVLPSIMTVDSQFKTVYSKEDITIRGWAISNSGVKEVRVYLDGTDLGVAAAEARPDVLAAYPNHTATASPGFHFTLLKSLIAPGAHTLQVKAISNDGTVTTSTHQFTEVGETPAVVIEKPKGSYSYEDIEVSGFALSSTGVKSVTVSVNGILVGSAKIGIERTDIATSYPMYTNAGTSGFTVSVARNRFARGNNTVTVKSTGTDGIVTTASVSISVDKPVLAPKAVLESPTVSAIGNDDIKVSGYALSEAGVKSVKVLLNGKPTGTATIGISRPDIATANPDYINAANSGFEYLVRKNTLFPGSNVITVTVTGNDGTVKTFTHNITVDKIPLIIVDAGHGGTDSGATGYLNGLKVYEKTYVLQYAHLLDAELRALGYRTLMTRTNDTFIPLLTRSDIANNADADLFFSFHHDASSDPNSQGAFLIYPHQKVVAVSDSAISESIDVATKLKTVFVNAGFKSRNNGYDLYISGHTLSVLRQSEMRSVLSEIGYMTNSPDLIKLTDPVMQKAIAYGLAQQIKAYFERR